MPGRRNGIRLRCGHDRAALADPVTIHYQQEITEIRRDDGGRFAAAGIEVGTILTGSVSYDTTTTNLFSSSANFDNWTATGMTADLPTGSVALLDPVVSVTDEGSADLWEAFGRASSADFQIRARARGDFGHQRDDATAPFYVGSGTGQPIIGPPAFDTEFAVEIVLFHATNTGASTGFVRNEALGTTTFSQTPFTAAPVPLPAGLPLLLGGLAVLAGFGHHVRRRGAAAPDRLPRPGRTGLGTEAGGAVPGRRPFRLRGAGGPRARSRNSLFTSEQTSSPEPRSMACVQP